MSKTYFNFLEQLLKLNGFERMPGKDFKEGMKEGWTRKALKVWITEKDEVVITKYDTTLFNIIKLNSKKALIAIFANQGLKVKATGGAKWK